MKNFAIPGISLLLLMILWTGCSRKAEQAAADSTAIDSVQAPPKKVEIDQPLVTRIYTADPSAHVFDGKIYIYPSHDFEAGIPADDTGAHFGMVDYRVLSMDSIGGAVTIGGVALDIKDVPWAGRQMWAPDAAFARGKYYLYFPVKDKQDVFRIGVATSTSPVGPFKAEAKPMKGSFSIDPAVFQDSDGRFYMYFGGIWGGQLQRWQSGKYDTAAVEPNDERPALGPKVAQLSKNMLEFEEPLKEVKILDEAGQPLKGNDHNRRFFEAAWMHKYNDTYYLSYSTGDTHFICYATGKSPYGPFTYRGVVLNPVEGWTNHHSIVEIKGKWYLFYHDSMLSGGKTHLRAVKVHELTYNPDGTIVTLNAYQ